MKRINGTLNELFGKDCNFIFPNECRVSVLGNDELEGAKIIVLEFRGEDPKATLALFPEREHWEAFLKSMIEANQQLSNNWENIK